MTSRLAHVLSLALVVAFCATGCATPAAAPAATESAPSTPSPTPTPEPEHTIAFGGDCANVLTLDEAQSLIGPSASISPITAGAQPGIGTLGGIDCRWDSGQGGASGPRGVWSIEVRAVPISAVDAGIIAEVEDARCDAWYDATVCRLGRTVGNVWLMASAGSGDTAAEPHAALLDSALTLASAHLTAFPGPVRLAPMPDWWVLGTCADLGERMGLEEILGEGYVTGWWEGNPGEQLEYRLTQAQGVEQICEWFPDYDSEASAGATAGIITATVWPGGAWDGDRLLADGTPITVTGAERAVTNADYPYVAFAVDGANAVQVNAYDADVADVLARLLAAQDG